MTKKPNTTKKIPGKRPEILRLENSTQKKENHKRHKEFMATTKHQQNKENFNTTNNYNKDTKSVTQLKIPGRMPEIHKLKLQHN